MVKCKVKEAVFIKKFKLSLLIVITLLLIVGCSESSSNIKDEVTHFSTQEETLEHFIENENIRGHIDLVTTTKNELLLVTQSSENIYFVGELKKDDEGFYASKISTSVHMEIGAAWELITMDDNEYTIFFEKTNEKPNFISLSNEEYFISIVEGHTLNKNSINVKNAIKEVDNIKE